MGRDRPILPDSQDIESLQAISFFHTNSDTAKEVVVSMQVLDLPIPLLTSRKGWSSDDRRLGE